jgi:hypothetical protein
VFGPHYQPLARGTPRGLENRTSLDPFSINRVALSWSAALAVTRVVGYSNPAHVGHRIPPAMLESRILDQRTRFGCPRTNNLSRQQWDSLVSSDIPYRGVPGAATGGDRAGA